MLLFIDDFLPNHMRIAYNISHLTVEFSRSFSQSAVATCKTKVKTKKKLSNYEDRRKENFF